MEQVEENQITNVSIHTCPESKREMTLICGRNVKTLDNGSMVSCYIS